MHVKRIKKIQSKIILGDVEMYLNRIENLRIDNDLLQKQVASKLKITRQQYSLYETGRRTIPIEKLIELANYYNVSLDYLCNRTNKKEINK